jgi:hypothetical protein
MDDDLKLEWGKSLSGDLLAIWPKDADGLPEKPAFLCTRSCNDLSDRLTMNMLQAYGIPCLSMERGDGGLGRVVLGMSGYGVDLYVPETLLSDARILIEEDDHEEL